MSYTVFARKYRPQTFSELVGQEHVSRTLSNAIETGRVAHAFLFTGVRGVGKTTSARILAKALCCENGPTPTPCLTCAPCTEIAAGIDMDVLEMDGASNNGVEDVRRLQETLPYQPARDRFKVVIVDEVHMLSTGAFNAFLKTLEEPPPHVKFIFATTEVHKVPITIRSRCQRYDFRLIPHPVIRKRVREILEEEKVTSDDAAVDIVAREAAGSMRDALTLLDQIVAFSGQQLSGEEVASSLGIASRALVLDTLRAVVTGDAAGALAAIDGLATKGVHMLHFAKELLTGMRDLVVLRVVGGDDPLLAHLASDREAADAIAASVDVLELQRCFAALSAVVEEVGQSAMPRIVLEMGLVRVATRPALTSVAELSARLAALSRGGPAPTSPTPGGRTAPSDASAAAAALAAIKGHGKRGPTMSHDEATRSASSAPAAQPAPPAAASAPRPAPSHSASQPARRQPPTTEVAAAHADLPPMPTEPSDYDMAHGYDMAHETRSVPSVQASAPAGVAARESVQRPNELRSEPPAGSHLRLVQDAPPPAHPSSSEMPRSEEHSLAARSHERAPVQEQAPIEEQRSSSPNTRPDTSHEQASQTSRGDVAAVGVDTDVWERLVSHVHNTQPAFAAVLENAIPRELSGKKALLVFAKAFHSAQASTPDSVDAIASLLEKHFGSRPSVVIRHDPSVDGGVTVAAMGQERVRAHREALKQEALDHPLVRDAIRMFPGVQPQVKIV